MLQGEKKKKWEPPPPPPRVGRKQRRAAAAGLGSKLPAVTPNAKCKLRLLKLERIKDWLLMEEEFLTNQERLRPQEERNQEDRTKVRPLRVPRHRQACSRLAVRYSHASQARGAQAFAGRHGVRLMLCRRRFELPPWGQIR